MKHAPRLVAALATLTAASCGSSQSASSQGDGGDLDGTSGASSGEGGSSDGSSGASSSGASGSSGAGSSDGGSSDSGGDAAAAYDFSVVQFHKNPTRDGVYVEPTFTKSAVTTMHKTSVMGTVTTQVYAQPLYVENGPGGVPAFIVATEENHVTAINASTGATIWDTGPSVIGAPVASGLMCGDISPVGITGTPYIAQGVIYFDAMTSTGGAIKHLVYAIKLTDGTVLAGWPLDVTAKITTFNSRGQNQRGALQLVNGTLYVPYGGHDGDCDTYFGWVVAVPTATPQSPTFWHTMAARGGIWATGSLPTDGTSVFPVTGNTTGASATTWGGGEAVIRLGAGATFSGAAADYFAPSNWYTLDGTDADLGGASAVLFDLAGSSTPHLVAQGGKDRNLYLANRDSLGGIGGQLLKMAVSTGEINAAPAVYTTSKSTYVAFHLRSGTGTTCPNGTNGNVISVKITAGPPLSASVAWCSTVTGLGSPMVTTTDGTSNAIVWAANNTLYGWDGDTGALVAGSTAANGTTLGTMGVQGWNTPITAHGKIAVGDHGALYLLSP
jgi:hypothetical protein